MGLNIFNNEWQLVDGCWVCNDESRRRLTKSIKEISNDLKDTESVQELTKEQCRVIAHTSFTTIPPADLPSVTDLISSGRLEQIASTELRNTILGYVQDVARVRDLIATLSENNDEISLKFPELVNVEMVIEDSNTNEVELTGKCDIKQLRNNQGFPNNFYHNAYLYLIYTERGVIELS